MRPSLLCSLALLLCFATIARAEDARRFTVGVIAPLSGPFERSGKTVRNSVELARSERPLAEHMRFVFEDDQLQPKLAVAAVQKLISQDHVDAILIWGTPNSLAINSIVERAKVPTIALSMADAVVRDKKFVMKHWLPARTITKSVLEEVAARGYRRVAIVTLMNDAMLLLRDQFVDQKVAEIVSVSEHTRDDTDFRATVAQLKRAAPDAVYTLLWAPQLSIFARQLRETRGSFPVFGTQNMEDRDEVAAAGRALDGAWFIGVDDSAAAEYSQKYRKRFGADPVAGGPNAFDATLMIIDGLPTGHLNDYLHHLRNFEGALGKYSAQSTNDFELGARLRCIRDGKIVDVCPREIAR